MSIISIIVPVYKVESYIHRCIDSILNQSFSDFKLVLVDDGSPDRCGAICDEYASMDNRIYVIHQKNGGLSAARNAGIDWAFENTDSSWLTFVDSDDWIHESYLQQLYHAVISAKSLLSVCGFFATTGEPFSEMPVKATWKRMEADLFYCGDFASVSTAAACGKLYHKSLFGDLRYPIGKLHEDEFTTYRAVYKAETVVLIEAELYAYYSNPDSITRSKWYPGRLDALEAFEKQIAYAKECNNQHLLNKATDSYVWAAALQAEQLSDQIKENYENKQYLDMLCRMIRSILHDGLNGRRYSFNRKNLLLYEMAYPIRPLWKFVHILYAQVKKLLRRKDHAEDQRYCPGI